MHNPLRELGLEGLELAAFRRRLPWPSRELRRGWPLRRGRVDQKLNQLPGVKLVGLDDGIPDRQPLLFELGYRSVYLAGLEVAQQLVEHLHLIEQVFRLLAKLGGRLLLRCHGPSLSPAWVRAVRVRALTSSPRSSGGSGSSSVRPSTRPGGLGGLALRNRRRARRQARSSLATRRSPSRSFSSSLIRHGPVGDEPRVALCVALLGLRGCHGPCGH